MRASLLRLFWRQFEWATALLVHAFRHFSVKTGAKPGGKGGAWRLVLGCSWPPLGRPSFEQTTCNIQVAKTPWQCLGRKSHCWKAHFFKICFFLGAIYFVGLSCPLYSHCSSQNCNIKPNMHGVDVDMTIWWVTSVTPPLKSPGYAFEKHT